MSHSCCGLHSQGQLANDCSHLAQSSLLFDARSATISCFLQAPKDAADIEAASVAGPVLGPASGFFLVPAQPELPNWRPEAVAAVAEWRETGANVQLLLLQHHLLACLQCALQKPGAGASLAADRLQQLLMADWVLLHRDQDWLNPELLNCALQASHCLLVSVLLAALFWRSQHLLGGAVTGAMLR